MANLVKAVIMISARGKSKTLKEGIYTFQRGTKRKVGE